jgi:hypothetical protein
MGRGGVVDIGDRVNRRAGEYGEMGMKTGWTIAMLACCAGTGVSVGQDSVSRNANGGNGLPGDALGPWAAANQRVSYVVDLAEWRTAWGTRLGVAPLIKSSKASTARFNSVNGAACISQAVRTGAAYPAGSYSAWFLAGGGLNAAENNTALNTTVNPTGSASVFGVAVMDYEDIVAGTSVVLTNHLFGAQVAFDPEHPGRLFVTRVNGASNSSGAAVADRSQFGLGSIDADGNMVFRADSFAAGGPATSNLQGDNYFRVRLPARSAASVNSIDNAGGSNAAATDWLLVRSPVTHGVPSAIPANLGSRSVVIGADFVGTLERESSAGVLTTTAAHRPGTMDHRGAAACSGVVLFPGSVATGSVLTRSTTGGGKTDSISVFGLDAAGGIVGGRTLTVPASLTDPCDAFAWPVAGGSIRGYDSQMTFRGGVGPAAAGRDLAGRGLVAATLYNGAVPNPSNPFNAIVAGRFDPSNSNSPVAWSVVAWVDSSAMTGKPILGDYGPDGAPGTGDAGEGDGVIDGSDAPIGRLASLFETSLGLTGPSMSSPALDAAGNVYFVASAAFNRRQGQQVVQDYDLGLFRAVYDPATMCYSLDLVLRAGSVVAGVNSARNYQVQSLSLADADSLSTGALWSSSTTQQAWNNADTASLPERSPQHLGGLVLAARVVYDVNQDGLFQDPTTPGGNAASVDEAYNVVLYVGNITPPPAGCDPDFNQDGNGDQDDVAYLVNAIGGGPNPTGRDLDFNLDGNADQDDVTALINVIAGGACP